MLKVLLILIQECLRPKNKKEKEEKRKESLRMLSDGWKKCDFLVKLVLLHCMLNSPVNNKGFS